MESEYNQRSLFFHLTLREKEHPPTLKSLRLLERKKTSGQELQFVVVHLKSRFEKSLVKTTKQETQSRLICWQAAEEI